MLKNYELKLFTSTIEQTIWFRESKIDNHQDEKASLISKSWATSQILDKKEYIFNYCISVIVQFSICNSCNRKYNLIETLSSRYVGPA